MSIDEMLDPKVSQKHFKTYADDSLHLIKLLMKHITELEIKIEGGIYLIHINAPSIVGLISANSQAF